MSKRRLSLDMPIIGYDSLDMPPLKMFKSPILELGKMHSGSKKKNECKIETDASRKSSENKKHLSGPCFSQLVDAKEQVEGGNLRRPSEEDKLRALIEKSKAKRSDPRLAICIEVGDKGNMRKQPTLEKAEGRKDFEICWWPKSHASSVLPTPPDKPSNISASSRAKEREKIEIYRCKKLPISSILPTPPDKPSYISASENAKEREKIEICRRQEQESRRMIENWYFLVRSNSAGQTEIEMQILRDAKACGPINY